MTEAKEKLDDLGAVRLIAETLGKFETTEQQRIMRWVQEKIGLTFMPPTEAVVFAKHADASEGPTPLSTVTHSDARSPDIRSFINSKQPSSDNQFAACVAYYYQFEASDEERKDLIGANDLQDATRKAGRPRLGDPAKTLSNASAQGWLDKKGRGSYSLNTVGENLVAMTLPSGSSTETPIKKKRVNKAKTVSKASSGKAVKKSTIKKR